MKQKILDRLKEMQSFVEKATPEELKQAYEDSMKRYEILNTLFPPSDNDWYEPISLDLENSDET